jgi:hypothetical protein
VPKLMPPLETIIGKRKTFASNIFFYKMMKKSARNKNILTDYYYMQ